MDNIAIVDKVKSLITPILERADIELIDVIYRREAGGMVLRISVDKKGGGITVDECAALNEELSVCLDEADIIQEGYTLELSSPGIDRPLSKSSDFRRIIGKTVEVFTKQPIEGKNVYYVGVVEGVDEDSVVIARQDKGSVRISLDNIQKAKQVVRF